MAEKAKVLYPFNGKLTPYEELPEEMQREIALHCAEVIERIVLTTLRMQKEVQND